MPQAIGLAILEALAISDIVIIPGLTFAGLVGTVALTGALIGLQLLLPKPGLPKQEDGSQPLRQAIPPRNGGYGRARPQPYYMLYEAQNGTSYDVLALVSGRIGGVAELYLHDDVVDVDGSGTVQGFPDGRYGGGRVKILTRNGQATETAYAEVVAALPSIWTPNHRGDGIASLALICAGVKAEDFTTVYPHGLPQPSAVMDLYPVWDPRDPAQSRDNPATWTVKDNPVLALIDYLTHPDHGMGLDYDSVIAPAIDEWMAEADLCDAPVAKRSGGTERRYRANGWYTFDTKPEDVLGALLSTCDGWLAEDADGVLRLYVGVYRAPDDRLTIRERHVLAFSVQHGVADEERINEIAISYISPDHRYKEVQCQPWRDEADISATGRVRSQQLSLSWVQSHSQARRLAKRAMARFAAPMRGEMTLTLFGLALLGRRWAPVQLPFVAGLEDAVVEIQGARVDLANGRVTIQWIVVDPATIDAWDPAMEEGDPPPVPDPGPGQSTLAPPTNLVAAPDIRTPFENTNVVVIAMSWDPSPRGDATAEAQYRLSSGGDDDWLSASVNAGNVGAETPPLVDGASYDVRVRYRVGSLRSDWTTVTHVQVGVPPGVPTDLSASLVAADVQIGARAPSSTNHYELVFYDAMTANFNAAQEIGRVPGAANSFAAFTHTAPAAGAHYYWVTSATASGVESAPAGPVSVTVNMPDPG